MNCSAKPMQKLPVACSPIFCRTIPDKESRAMSDPTTPAALIATNVDRGFEAETAFLAELVKIPTDNPPGDCQTHANKAGVLLEGLGFSVERHPVPAAALSAVGMISATNLIV